MLRFIIRRLLITIPTILVVITITWGLVRLAPGNSTPARSHSRGNRKEHSRKVWSGQTVVRAVSADDVEHSAHFDFGTSLEIRRTVGQRDHRAFAAGLSTVGILAYLLALVVGITAGSIAALKQNSKWDYASMALAMLGISVPNFVLGQFWFSFFR